MERLDVGGIYHVFNRAVDHRLAFEDDHDRERFLRTLEHHRVPKTVALSQLHRFKNDLTAVRELRESPLVAVLSCCVMPNHFHLLLRQEAEDGISQYAQRFLNSYTRYYNTRHRRKGPLFEGAFRAVRIETDEQFLHVSRYIHLNPVVAHLTDDAFAYPWSGAAAYGLRRFEPPVSRVEQLVMLSTELLSAMIPPAEYERFVQDHIAYARTLASIKHLLLEEDVLRVPNIQPSRLDIQHPTSKVGC